MSGSSAGDVSRVGAHHPPATADMSGKVAVVTGGNSGIGYATAKALAVLGAHVIIACRSEQRAVAAIHQMKREVCSGDDPGLRRRRSIMVEYMHLDLASLDSVRRFTSTLRDRDQPLDVLINNAGISWAHYGLTEDGFEQHYQVNHLGHFLLTLELLPLLETTAERTGDCRVVFVASRRHTQGAFDPRNINGEISYSRYAFYNNSKLYNVMTAYALQRRLKGSRITVSSLHPGLTDTEMSRNMADMVVVSAFAKALKALSIGWRSAEKGAATSLYVATQPGLNSQQCHYYSNCRARQSSALSRNEELQEQLWALSVRDVREHLSLQTRERFGPGQTPRGAADPLPRARRHSYRSAIRAKPEDRERLIDPVYPSREGAGEWGCNEGWIEGTEEEGEGE